MDELLDRAFACVVALSKKYNIDESHGLSHSLAVLQFAQGIYRAEREKHPELEKHERVVVVAAIVHDMCDKKYTDEEEGVRDILGFMRPSLDEASLGAVVRIITSMSYSTVRRAGYPEDLGEYLLAYHIVREADLLAAYDIDRCVVYGMLKKGYAYGESAARAKALYEARVMTYLSDGLFVTDCGRETAEALVLRVFLQNEIVSG